MKLQDWANLFYLWSNPPGAPEFTPIAVTVVLQLLHTCTRWYVMNMKRTGLWLRQTEHVRGHLWHTSIFRKNILHEHILNFFRGQYNFFFCIYIYIGYFNISDPFIIHQTPVINPGSINDTHFISLKRLVYWYSYIKHGGWLIHHHFIIYTTDVSTEAGTVYSSEKPEFINIILWASCYSIFNFLCSVL